jgi:hypothetical protein
MPTISQVLTALISALLGRRFAVLAWLGIVAWRKKTYGKRSIFDGKKLGIYMENTWRNMEYGTHPSFFWERYGEHMGIMVNPRSS